MPPSVIHPDEDNIPVINDVESLRQGNIKTLRNSAKRPYTILLLGENSVGKSSLVEFIGNVLTGVLTRNDIDDYNFNILDRNIELGGPNNQSETIAPHWYKFTSTNGIMVRILDTPGFADTHSIQQNELHKRDLATQDNENIGPITAVLILANGDVSRVRVGAGDPLSICSTMFPKSVAPNVSLIFTKVVSPLQWDFSPNTIPLDLQGAPRFLLNNPIALKKQYYKLKGDPKEEKKAADLCNAVKPGEQNALEMLVKLFDWLDGLEPRGTTEIVTESQPTVLDPVAIDSAGMEQSSPRKFRWPWRKKKRR